MTERLPQPATESCFPYKSEHTNIYALCIFQVFLKEYSISIVRMEMFHLFYFIRFV